MYWSWRTYMCRVRFSRHIYKQAQRSFPSPNHPSYCHQGKTSTSRMAPQLVSFLTWCQGTGLSPQVRGTASCKILADIIPHADGVPPLIRCTHKLQTTKTFPINFFSWTSLWCLLMAITSSHSHTDNSKAEHKKSPNPCSSPLPVPIPRLLPLRICQQNNCIWNK